MKLHAISSQLSTQVKIHYSKSSKTCDLTPQRAVAVAQLSRGHFESAADNLVKHEQLDKHIMYSLCRQIKGEMDNICSLKHNSMLRDQHEAIKNFSWKTLWFEFSQGVPALVKFLTSILPNADEKFLSFLIAIILKKRCKHMSLVQRMISILLYGNATNKQVV